MNELIAAVDKDALAEAMKDDKLKLAKKIEMLSRWYPLSVEKIEYSFDENAKPQSGGDDALDKLLAFVDNGLHTALKGNDDRTDEMNALIADVDEEVLTEAKKDEDLHLEKKLDMLSRWYPLSVEKIEYSFDETAEPEAGDSLEKNVIENVDSQSGGMSLDDLFSKAASLKEDVQFMIDDEQDSQSIQDAQDTLDRINAEIDKIRAKFTADLDKQIAALTLSLQKDMADHEECQRQLAELLQKRSTQSGGMSLDDLFSKAASMKEDVQFMIDDEQDSQSIQDAQDTLDRINVEIDKIRAKFTAELDKQIAELKRKSEEIRAAIEECRRRLKDLQDRDLTNGESSGDQPGSSPADAAMNAQLLKDLVKAVDDIENKPNRSWDVEIMMTLKMAFDAAYGAAVDAKLGEKAAEQKKRYDDLQAAISKETDAEMDAYDAAKPSLDAAERKDHLEDPSKCGRNKDKADATVDTVQTRRYKAALADATAELMKTSDAATLCTKVAVDIRKATEELKRETTLLILALKNGFGYIEIATQKTGLSKKFAEPQGSEVHVYNTPECRLALNAYLAAAKAWAEQEAAALKRAAEVEAAIQALQAQAAAKKYECGQPITSFTLQTPAGFAYQLDKKYAEEVARLEKLHKLNLDKFIAEMSQKSAAMIGKGRAELSTITDLAGATNETTFENLVFVKCLRMLGLNENADKIKAVFAAPKGLPDSEFQEILESDDPKERDDMSEEQKKQIAAVIAHANFLKNHETMAKKAIADCLGLADTGSVDKGAFANNISKANVLNVLPADKNKFPNSAACKKARAKSDMAENDLKIAKAFWDAYCDAMEVRGKGVDSRVDHSAWFKEWEKKLEDILTSGFELKFNGKFTDPLATRQQGPGGFKLDYAPKNMFDEHKKRFYTKGNAQGNMNQRPDVVSDVFGVNKLGADDAELKKDHRTDRIKTADITVEALQKGDPGQNNGDKTGRYSARPGSYLEDPFTAKLYVSRKKPREDSLVLPFFNVVDLVDPRPDQGGASMGDFFDELTPGKKVPVTKAWTKLSLDLVETLQYLNMVWYSDMFNRLKDPTVFSNVLLDNAKSALQDKEKAMLRDIPTMFWVKEEDCYAIQVCCAKRDKASSAEDGIANRLREVRAIDTTHFYALINSAIEDSDTKPSNDARNQSWITLEHCLQMAIRAIDGWQELEPTADTRSTFLWTVSNVMNLTARCVKDAVDIFKVLEYKNYISSQEPSGDKQLFSYTHGLTSKQTRDRPFPGVVSYLRITKRSDTHVRRLPVLTNMGQDVVRDVMPRFVDVPYKSYRYASFEEDACDRITEDFSMPAPVLTDPMGNKITAGSLSHFTYHLGPFNEVFPSYIDNDKIVEDHCDELKIAMQKKMNIFIFGYGPSGSGKTSALINFNGGRYDAARDKAAKTPADRDAYLKSTQSVPGIIPKLLDAEKNITKVVMEIVEYYSIDDVERGYDLLNINPVKIKDGEKRQPIGDKTYETATFTRKNDSLVLMNPEANYLYQYLQKNVVGESQNFGGETVKDAQDYLKTMTSIGGFMTAYLDLIRLVFPTTNNPESSRSHVVLYLKINDDYTIAVGDFAGVESSFDCNTLFKGFETYIVTKPSTLIKKRRAFHLEPPYTPGLVMTEGIYPEIDNTYKYGKHYLPKNDTFVPVYNRLMDIVEKVKLPKGSIAGDPLLLIQTSLDEKFAEVYSACTSLYRAWKVFIDAWADVKENPMTSTYVDNNAASGITHNIFSEEQLTGIAKNIQILGIGGTHELHETVPVMTKPAWNSSGGGRHTCSSGGAQQTKVSRPGADDRWTIPGVAGKETCHVCTVYFMFMYVQFDKLVTYVEEFMKQFYKDFDQYLTIFGECVVRDQEGRYITRALDNLRGFFKHEMKQITRSGKYTVQYSDGCMNQICNPVLGNCDNNLLRPIDPKGFNADVKNWRMIPDIKKAFGNKPFLPVIMTVVNMDPKNVMEDDKIVTADVAPTPYIDIHDLKHLVSVKKYLAEEGLQPGMIKALGDLSAKAVNASPARVAARAGDVGIPAVLAQPVPLQDAVEVVMTDEFKGQLSAVTKSIATARFHIPVFDRKMEETIILMIQRRLAYLADVIHSFSPEGPGATIDFNKLVEIMNYLEVLAQNARDHKPFDFKTANIVIHEIDQLNSLSIIGCLEFTDQFSKFLNNDSFCRSSPDAEVLKAGRALKLDLERSRSCNDGLTVDQEIGKVSPFLQHLHHLAAGELSAVLRYLKDIEFDERFTMFVRKHETSVKPLTFAYKFEDDGSTDKVPQPLPLEGDITDGLPQTPMNPYVPNVISLTPTELQIRANAELMKGGAAVGHTLWTLKPTPTTAPAPLKDAMEMTFTIRKGPLKALKGSVESGRAYKNIGFGFVSTVRIFMKHMIDEGPRNFHMAVEGGFIHCIRESLAVHIDPAQSVGMTSRFSPMSVFVANNKPPSQVQENIMYEGFKAVTRLRKYAGEQPAGQVFYYNNTAELANVNQTELAWSEDFVTMANILRNQGYMESMGIDKHNARRLETYLVYFLQQFYLTKKNVGPNFAPNLHFVVPRITWAEALHVRRTFIECAANMISPPASASDPVRKAANKRYEALLRSIKKMDEDHKTFANGAGQATFKAYNLVKTKADQDKHGPYKTDQTSGQILDKVFTVADVKNQSTKLAEYYNGTTGVPLNNPVFRDMLMLALEDTVPFDIKEYLAVGGNPNACYDAYILGYLELNSKGDATDPPSSLDRYKYLMNLMTQIVRYHKIRDYDQKVSRSNYSAHSLADISKTKPFVLRRPTSKPTTTEQAVASYNFPRDPKVTDVTSVEKISQKPAKSYCCLIPVKGGVQCPTAIGYEDHSENNTFIREIEALYPDHVPRFDAMDDNDFLKNINNMASP